jgi:hypothetical protein
VSFISGSDASIATRLRNVTNELRQIEDLLTSEKDVDPLILTDFRDSVNRVRNTAWAVQQYAESKATEKDPRTVLALLGGERVRAAYQLCKLVQTDLANPEIHLQKGQLLQLYDATKQLVRQLGEVVGG